jgi:hypothetical protein
MADAVVVSEDILNRARNGIYIQFEASDCFKNFHTADIEWCIDETGLRDFIENQIMVNATFQASLIVEYKLRHKRG